MIFPKNLKYNLFNQLILVIIGFAFYANSFGNEFTNWDDGMCYAPRVLSIKYIFELFIKSSGTYQPFRELSYAIDYTLWGKNPFGYHLQNLFWYLLTGQIIYLFLDVLFYKNMNNRKIWLLVASLFFLLHPIHVEAVTWLSGRKFVLMGFFFFLSFYLFIIFLNTLSGYRVIYYLSSFTSFLIALFSQPIAVVFPVCLLFYDLLFFKNLEFKKFIRERWKVHLLYWLPNLFIISYFAFKAGTAYPSYPVGSFYLTFLLMLKVFYLYIMKIIIPFNLCARYAFPTPTSILNSDIFLSMIFIIIFTCCAILSFLKNKKLILFSILWFLIGLIPTSNLIPISTLMADRYIYISSFAFCILIIAFGKKFKNKSILLIAFSCIIILGILTLSRNKVWTNSESLWVDTIAKYPTDLAYLNLGHHYQEQNHPKKAEIFYKKALDMNPDHEGAHFNLGNTYFSLKNWERAKKAFEWVIKNSSHTTRKYESLINLGVIYKRDNDFQKSLKFYNLAIKLKSDSPEAYNNIGNIYYKQNALDLAEKYYLKSIELDQEFAIAYYSLGNLYYKKNNKTRALIEFKKMIELSPNHADSYKNIGLICFELNDIPGALKHLNKSLELNPNQPNEKDIKALILKLKTKK
jgi:tetratricopeptide (TPR) repeat protein